MVAGGLLARLAVAERDGLTIARLQGEIDASNARGLGAELRACISNQAVGVVLDLSGVGYIDSSGIRLIFELAGRLEARRQEFRLVVPEEALIRLILATAAVERVVPVHASLAEARGSIEAADQP